MSSRRIYLSIFFASLASALAAWLIVNLSHPLLRLPDDLFGLTQPSTEQYARIRAHQNLNDSIALTMFSAIAMVAGIPVFGKQKKWLPVAGWLIVAVCLGAGAGWLMAINGFYCEFWLPISWDALVRVSVRMTAMLLPLALLAAAMTLICNRNLKQAPMLLIAAILGSMAASVAYTLITGIALPRENADAVLPHGTISRLLLFGLAPLAIWATIEHQHQGGRRDGQAPTAEVNVA